MNSSADASEGLLRAMVREVLRDVVGEEIRVQRGHATRARASGTAGMAVTSQADLDAVVRRVLHASADERRDLESGRLRFTLAASPTSAPTRVDGPLGEPDPTMRISRGAVTERMVDQAARDGRGLVLGPRAVLTPLARDRARSRGVTITREHQP